METKKILLISLLSFLTWLDQAHGGSNPQAMKTKKEM
jgi:hypothetical protein